MVEREVQQLEGEVTYKYSACTSGPFIKMSLFI